MQTIEKSKNINYLKRIQSGDITNKKILTITSKIILLESVNRPGQYSLYKRDGVKVGNFSINDASGDSEQYFLSISPDNGSRTEKWMDKTSVSNIIEFMIISLCKAYKFHGGE